MRVGKLHRAHSAVFVALSRISSSIANWPTALQLTDALIARIVAGFMSGWTVCKKAWKIGWTVLLCPV